MKKIIAIAILVASTSVLAQYQPKCVQQLVCGPAGCYPVVVCF